MRRLFVLLVVATAACGGGAKSSPAPASGAPSAAPASSAPATAEPDAGAPSGRCLASLARKRPAGWRDSGTLTVTLVDDHPTKIGDQAIQAQTAEDARRALRDAVCRAGGVLGVLEGKPPKNGVATIAVVVPAKEDEAADVALLCKEPKGMPRDLDDPQRLRIAFETYSEQLSSTKWRGWLFDMTDELAHADDAARRAIRKKYAATLKKAPGASASCWFAAGLER